MKFIKAYLAVAVAFLIVDIAWITVFLKAVYDETLGSMMLEAPRGGGAIGFYVGYIAVIVYLAVLPGVREGRVQVALTNGAALGAAAYGTYTLTNYALFGPWTWTLVVSDIAWGAFLTAISALAGYFAARGSSGKAADIAGQ